MRYFSTRGGEFVTGAQAVLTGLTPDGGLCLPEFDWRRIAAAGFVYEIL